MEACRDAWRVPQLTLVWKAQVGTTLEMPDVLRKERGPVETVIARP